MLSAATLVRVREILPVRAACKSFCSACQNVLSDDVELSSLCRQGIELLREVTSVDPHEYDQQQKDDAAGIRNVSAFVQELAER